MRRKYDELAQAYREKGRKLLQTQELYDRVKRKGELGQMQAAASYEVETQLGIPTLERQSPQDAPGRGFYEQQASAVGLGVGARQSFQHQSPPGMPPPAPRGFSVTSNGEGTWRRPAIPTGGKRMSPCSIT